MKVGTRRRRRKGAVPAPEGTVERLADGLGVSPGIAIGPAHVSERGVLEVPEYHVPEGEREAERLRLADALRRSRQQLEKLKKKSAVLPDSAAEELGYLLDAHMHMLRDSRLVRGVDARIADDGLNAEAAVQAEISRIVQDFARTSDVYLAARMQDIREVGERLVRSLTNTPYQAFSQLPEGSVVLAEELSPADTALMAPGLVSGMATEFGGAEGHTAIMARSLGLPAVLGVAGLMGVVGGGDTVIVDGSAGRVIVDPTPETLAHYRRRREEYEREGRRLARLRNLPAVTRDGSVIELQANIELPVEVDAVLRSGARGVGLLRSEYQFMNREDLPDEEEQYRSLAGIVTGLDGLPVTVRTLDIGGDKLAYTLGGFASESANPALGLRAIRLSLKEPRLLETQLSAILRAGAHGSLRILLPMISTVAEVRQVREVMARMVTRLRRRRVAIADPLPPLGVMIEVPGAALTADALAREADFFAIGTNDLTMYALATDRGDEQVAHLYNPLHPAVLRLIQFSAQAALRAQIPVCLCGEMAGDPRMTALLLGLGIRELSMSAGSVPRVKERIRSMDLLGATQRASLIMDQWDSGRIAALLDDFNALA